MPPRKPTLLLAPLLGCVLLLGLLLALGAPANPGIALAELLAPHQEFRDVAGVRIWADTILQTTGRITATGNVQLGPAGTEQRWFSISQSAIAITATNRMTLTGQLATVGSNQLLSGTFPVNAATGELSIPLDSLNLYRKLGDSNIAITPTYTINMRQPEVNVNAKVDLQLPEGSLRPDIRFKLGFNGKITGTATVPINLRLVGGVLTATVTISQTGLAAKSAVLAVDNFNLTLSDLLIDGQGDLKLRFGAGVDFPVPDLDLGDGFFVLERLRGQLGLRVNQNNQPLGYQIGLRGQLRMSQLPENTVITATATSLLLTNGALSGGVEAFAVKYSGNTMRFRGVTFGQAQVVAQRPPAEIAAGVGPAAPSFKRVLFAQGADFELPKEFRPADEITPTVHLQNVTIQSAAPYVTVGGAGLSFVIGKEYVMGGDPSAINNIKLSNIRGRVDYNFTESRWSTSLTATLGLKLGSDLATSVTGNLTTDSTGKFRTRLVGVTLGVAGAELAVNQLDLQGDVFTAGSATLRLPQGFGNVTVNNVRIDSRGVRLTGGSFALPDLSYTALKLTENRGEFRVNGANYSVEVTSTIRIEGGATPLPGSGGSTGVLVRGKLTIRNGTITGTMDQFGFMLSGAEFRLTNPRFLNNRVIADNASLLLPTGVTNMTVSANGIEIGGSRGFKFRQPTIQLSDFTIAGVGIRRPQLTFEQRNNGFILKGSGELAFTQFTVAGDFTITRNGSQLAFNPVMLDFRATPGIPLGQSGFELTRITGNFNLSNNTAIIQLGVRIESQVRVVIPIVAMDGTITLQVVPSFDLRARAGVQVVGINVSTADLHITPRAATLNGTLEYQVARQIVDLSFGVDGNDEFTMFGSMRGELGLRKGSLIHWCVPFAGCVDVPPSTMTLASITYDAGKFKDRRPGQNNRTVWGGRAQFRLLGNRAYAFLRLAPTPNDIIVGANLDDYRPVNPARAGLPLAADEPDYIAADGVHTFAIARASELLVFGEVVTPTNIGLYAPPLRLTSPSGEQFSLDAAFTQEDGSFRIYSLTYPTPTAAVGVWTAVSMPGNAVKAWGQQPGVQVKRFAVHTEFMQTLARAGEVQNVTIANGQPLLIQAEVTKPEPGLTVQLFAAGAQGERYDILEVSAETTHTVTIDQVWTTNLPRGVYTFTLVADDFGASLAVTSTAGVEVVDTTPPAAPSTLTGQPQVDGSVLLHWAASTASDLAGYTFAIDGEPAYAVDGVDQEYVIAGLPAAVVHTIAVRAYDSSGNVSNPATVQVSLPAFRLESLTPAQDDLATQVGAVIAAFNAPIQGATLSVVDSQGQPVAGQVHPYLVELDAETTGNFGAELALDTFLAPGVYTATVTAQPLAGAPLVWPWRFTVEAATAAPGLFLPLVAR